MKQTDVMVLVNNKELLKDSESKGKQFKEVKTNLPILNIVNKKGVLITESLQSQNNVSIAKKNRSLSKSNLVAINKLPFKDFTDKKKVAVRPDSLVVGRY
jgi:hypothetical protein